MLKKKASATRFSLRRGEGMRRKYFLSFVDQGMLSAFSLALGKYFRDIIRTDIHLTLLGGAFGSLVIQFFITGIGFITGIVLARVLGPSGFGAYVYATTVAALLMVPATLGLPQLLIRETSRYDSENAHNKMHGLFKWAFSVSVPFACVLAGVAALVTWQLSPLIAPDLTTILLIAFLLVPIASIAKLSGSALQGLHHVLLGQIPLSVLNSALFLALIVSAYLFFAPLLTAASAVAANVFASSIACIAAVYLLCLKTPKSQPGTSLSYQTPSWLRSAFAFLFVDIVHYINSQADILILGALGGMEDVGLYRPATRVMLLVSFGLNAMNMALRPVVARSHAAGDHDRLQSLVTAAAKLTMLYAIPSVIFVIVFGQWILSLYGAPFIVGYKALVILALGQLVNTGMGAVALLLNMTGHQSTVLKGVGLAAILNVFLNFVLIPRFGIVGAALASALSMIVWNGLLFVAVRRTLGINPTVFRRASL